MSILIGNGYLLIPPPFRVCLTHGRGVRMVEVRPIAGLSHVALSKRKCATRQKREGKREHECSEDMKGNVIFHPLT